MLSNSNFNPSNYINNSQGKQKFDKATSPNMPARADSKLSAGPANPRHRAFLRNEQAIQRVFFRAIAQRNISVRVSWICQQAQITPPTFYLHHRNCNEALTTYEDQLLQEFSSAAKYLSRTDAFALLLIFIAKHHQYFQACFESHNLYLLHKILNHLRPQIVSSDVNTKTYAVYCASITAVIIWWGTKEHFSKKAMPSYVKQLMSIRIMYYK